MQILLKIGSILKFHENYTNIEWVGEVGYLEVEIDLVLKWH